MPILASVAASTPGPVVVTEVDGRRIDFAALDGTVLEAYPSSRKIIITSGVTGLEVPPRRYATDEYPGLDGARLRKGGVSTGPRPVGLPLFFYGEGTARSVREVLAEMRALLDYRRTDYATDEGTFDLVATGIDGVTQRRLRCLYVDGMEGSYGYAADGVWWMRCGLNLLAVNPYWRGGEWSTPVVALPQPRPFLRVSTAPSGYLVLSTSTALGADMPVSVGGDVDSPAIIELTGPADAGTTVTSPAGLSFTLAALASGDHLVADTGSPLTGRQVSVTLNGDEDAGWAKVGVNPRWAPLPPGDTTISITVPGATSATRAWVHGVEIFETAFP